MNQPPKKSTGILLLHGDSPSELSSRLDDATASEPKVGIVTGPIKPQARFPCELNHNVFPSYNK